MSLDLTNLPLRELRALQDSIRSQLWEHPEMTSLVPVFEAIKAKLLSDPRYQKGLELLRIAVKESGLEDGYARPQDYYFATHLQDIVHQVGYGENAKHEPTGEKSVALILCYKWNWWFNGESYLHHKDGHRSRNFSEFLTEEIQNRYDEDGSWGDNPEPLRQCLLKAGLEEKPELIELYEEACVASWNKRLLAMLDERPSDTQLE